MKSYLTSLLFVQITIFHALAQSNTDKDTSLEKTISTPNVTSSDEKNKISDGVIIPTKSRDLKNINSAGDELINASNSAFASIVLSIGGTLITFFGAYTLSLPMMGVGGMAAIIATIVFVDAFNHIKKAGEILNKQTISKN